MIQYVVDCNETKLQIVDGYVTFDTNLLCCVLCCMSCMSFDDVCLNWFVQGTTVVQQTNQRICSSSNSMYWNLCSLMVARRFLGVTETDHVPWLV
jgi:hypothetical protein